MKLILFILLFLASPYAYSKAVSICSYSNGKFRKVSSVERFCHRGINSRLIACCGYEESSVISEEDLEFNCQNYITTIFSENNCELSTREAEDLRKIANGELDVPHSKPTQKSKKSLTDLIANRVCQAINTEIKSVEEGKRLVDKVLHPKVNFFAGTDPYRLAKACSYTLQDCLNSDKSIAPTLEESPWYPGPLPDLISGPEARYKESWCYKAIQLKAKKENYYDNKTCEDFISEEVKSYGNEITSLQSKRSSNFGLPACRVRSSENKPVNNVLLEYLNNTVESIFSSTRE